MVCSTENPSTVTTQTLNMHADIPGCQRVRSYECGKGPVVPTLLPRILFPRRITFASNEV